MTLKKKYVGTDGQVFTVDEILTVDQKLYVHYTKESTGQKYSCLLEAFTERFKELLQ